MDREGEGAAAAAAAASSSQANRPGRRVDPLLVTCRFFSIVTTLTAILCIVSNVISAIRSFKNNSDISDGIGILGWRGMLQIFVAVMTKAFPVYSVEKRELILLQDAASYLLLACGAVYVVSGIMCIGFLKRAREEKETAKDRIVNDLQDLESQKQELERLLISETV